MRRWVLCAAIVLSPAVARAEGAGEIDWQRRVLKAPGQGAPDLNAPSIAVARLSAERAAIATAQRNALDALKDAALENGSTVEGLLQTDGALRQKVEAKVRSARVVKTHYFSDGGVSLEVEVPLDQLPPPIADHLKTPAGFEARSGPKDSPPAASPKTSGSPAAGQVPAPPRTSAPGLGGEAPAAAAPAAGDAPKAPAAGESPKGTAPPAAGEASAPSSSSAPAVEDKPSETAAPTPEGNAVHLTVRNVASLAQAAAFKGAVAQRVRGVKAVAQRSYSDGTQELDVTLAGSTEEFAQQLEAKRLGKFSVRVTGLGVKSIDVELGR